MKNILITLTLVACSLTVPSQAQPLSKGEQADSIAVLLPQMHDTARLDALRVILKLVEGLPEDRHYTKMFLNEARRQKDVQAEAFALITLTAIYWTQYDTDSVYIFGEEAIDFTRKHQIYDYMAYTQRQIIRRHAKDSRVLTALNIAKEAYEEAKTRDDNISMGVFLGAIGDIYYDLRQFDQAAQYFLESNERLLQNRDPKSLTILNNYFFATWMFRHLEDWQQSLRYADSMGVEIIFLQDIHPNFDFDTYRFYKEFLSAVAYAELAMLTVETRHATSLQNLSMQAIRKAEEVYDSRWRDELLHASIHDMYGTYYIATSDYNRALEHLQKLLDYNEKEQIDINILATKRSMARAYSEKGDFRNAFLLQSQIMQKQDSLNKEQFYSQINELRSIHELDQIQMEADRQKARADRQRLLITALAFACLGLMVIVGLIVWNRRRIMEKNRGLYRQIKEQDHLAEELERTKALLKGATATDATHPPDGSDLPDAPSEHDQNLVANLREYLLQDRMFDKHDLESNELALHLGTHRAALFTAVKNVTGKTLLDYLNSTRMDKARQLLEGSAETPIEVISEMCGFVSRATFYRQFSSYYGLPPAEYRRIAWKSM
ncbi:MAG: AraC family transcriptional regulator [Bacteroidales bacterium]|nr:AraC family transcriptional regulator [Bacteroidales bacterium]